jgi:hypothetical protein
MVTIEKKNKGSSKKPVPRHVNGENAIFSANITIINANKSEQEINVLIFLISFIPTRFFPV